MARARQRERVGRCGVQSPMTARGHGRAGSVTHPSDRHPAGRAGSADCHAAGSANAEQTAIAVACVERRRRDVLIGVKRLVPFPGQTRTTWRCRPHTRQQPVHAFSPCNTGLASHTNQQPARSLPPSMASRARLVNASDDRNGLTIGLCAEAQSRGRENSTGWLQPNICQVALCAVATTSTSVYVHHRRQLWSSGAVEHDPSGQGTSLKWTRGTRDQSKRSISSRPSAWSWSRHTCASSHKRVVSIVMQSGW